MTIAASQYWNDDRLNQLASDVEANKTAITDLRATAEALLQVAQIHQQDIEVLSANLQGLQVETRRLIEELRQGRSE